jgi:hypothetical protein
MKTGQGNKNGLTWSDIREISREMKGLSARLPDTGRCTNTQLGHIDFELLTSPVRGSRGADRETGHLAPSGGNPFPSPSFSE